MEVKLTEEAKDFILGNSTSLYENGNIKYSYIPYWFEWLDNGNFKIHNFENIPEELKIAINKRRTINTIIVDPT